VWLTLRKAGITNREEIVTLFGRVALSYYPEMAVALQEHSVADMAHVLVFCGVHYCVEDLYKPIPGTKILWSDLIQKSLIFPYLQNTFIFPFALVWNTVSSEAVERRQAEVEKYCSEKVRNLNIRALFISFEDLCVRNLYNLGVLFETFVVSSMAVKYDIWTLSNPHFTAAPLEELYDFYLKTMLKSCLPSWT
jgi:hypothetical protein